MINKAELTNQLKRLKPELDRKFGVIKVGFFEDYIDTRHTENCEVNVLVEFRQPLGWKFFELKGWLEFKLDRRIDICTPRSLKPAIKEEIIHQTIFV